MIVEVKKKPPLKGVAQQFGSRRAREILHQRRLKQMEEEKKAEMFEKESQIMKHKYGNHYERKTSGKEELPYGMIHKQ